MNLNYTQDTKNIWFPDQREPIYDPKNPHLLKIFREYWKQEKDRCINGFTLADEQVKIPGRLYFHTVYWKIAAYVPDPETGKKPRKIITPFFRDLEWEIFNDIEECDRQGLFYSLVGSRDFGKSVIAGSLSGHLYTFYNNSESVISAGADNYIKLATDKIEDGLTNLHPLLKKQRVSNDWKKEIKAGWKDKRTNQPHPKSSLSKILIRNYEAGNKTMAANGTRPGFHLIDEIGTLPNLIGCIKDSDGCWWSGGGNKPSCLAMFCGTGGDMEVGAEAAEIFFNPYSYNLLSFDNPETGGKMGRFISALRIKLDYKEEQTLGQYLGIDHPDLEKITILVSNEERARTEWWNREHEKARKSGNPKTLVKFKAYWPIVPSDSFLVISANNYNVEAAKKQQSRLRTLAQESSGIIGIPVELFYDGEKVSHRFTDRLPISEYPVKSQDTNAPIVIYEFPISDSPPWGLYIAGVDPYRMDDAESSSSLGAIYIYKRIHEIASEKYQDMFVASYVGRTPGSVDDWNENARMLIKYYNAFALVENDDMTFIRYMQNKNDGHFLADQPAWLKEIVPFSDVKRGKGIHRSSEKVRNFLRTCLKRYLDEILYKEVDEKGSVIVETLGVQRVEDIMLLEEIIKYNKDGNFDREVAASLAIALADKMSPMGKVLSANQDPRFISYFSNKSRPSMIAHSGYSLTKKSSKRKLFY